MASDPLGIKDAVNIADGIINSEILVDAEFTNITPALVGGWLGGWSSEPGGYIIEPPRPTDIIGKARWWARAIIGGLIYELTGYFPTLRTANELIDEVFGKIDKSGRGAEASKLVIMTENTSPIKSLNYPDINTREIRQLKWNLLKEPDINTCKYNYLEPCPPNLILLSKILISRKVQHQLLSRKDRPAKMTNRNYDLISLPPCTYRFRLKATLRKDTDPFWEALLGYSLALALKVTGIGRNTSRGYGKLKLINAKVNSESIFGSRFVKIINKLSKKSSLVEISKQVIKDLHKLAENSRIHEYLLSRLDCKHTSKYPYYPILHYKWIIDKEILKVISKEVFKVMYAINESTSFKNYIKFINNSSLSKGTMEEKEFLFKILNGAPRMPPKKKIATVCLGHLCIDERIPSLIKYYVVADSSNGYICLRLASFPHQVSIDIGSSYNYNNYNEKVKLIKEIYIENRFKYMIVKTKNKISVLIPREFIEYIVNTIVRLTDYKYNEIK